MGDYGAPLSRIPRLGGWATSVWDPQACMGATQFLTRTLGKVRTEMSLHVLAYNLKRMITIFGVGPLMAAIRT